MAEDKDLEAYLEAQTNWTMAINRIGGPSDLREFASAVRSLPVRCLDSAGQTAFVAISPEQFRLLMKDHELLCKVVAAINS